MIWILKHSCYASNKWLVDSVYDDIDQFEAEGKTRLAFLNNLGQWQAKAVEEL